MGLLFSRGDWNRAGFLGCCCEEDLIYRVGFLLLFVSTFQSVRKEESLMGIIYFRLRRVLSVGKGSKFVVYEEFFFFCVCFCKRS